jgi:hypothetical protein
LAFFIAGACVFAGVSAEVCGLRDPGFSAGQGPIPHSLAPSSLALCCVKILKSASTKISLVTNQELTRGLFKRLDGIIAWAGEPPTGTNNNPGAIAWQHQWSDCL